AGARKSKHLSVQDGGNKVGGSSLPATLGFWPLSSTASRRRRPRRRGRHSPRAACRCWSSPRTTPPGTTWPGSPQTFRRRIFINPAGSATMSSSTASPSSSTSSEDGSSACLRSARVGDLCRLDGGDLRDRPRVARAEQGGEVRFFLLTGRRELLFHQVVVDRPLDVTENSDRRRADGVAGQTGERERRRG